jgi:hypothetical protein
MRRVRFMICYWNSLRGLNVSCLLHTPIVLYSQWPVKIFVNGYGLEYSDTLRALLEGEVLSTLDTMELGENPHLNRVLTPVDRISAVSIQVRNPIIVHISSFIPFTTMTSLMSSKLSAWWSPMLGTQASMLFWYCFFPQLPALSNQLLHYFNGTSKFYILGYPPPSTTCSPKTWRLGNCVPQVVPWS